MKLHYYPETDSLYIDLSGRDGDSTVSREVSPGVVLDFNTNGKLVGIDLEHASQHVNLSTLDIEDLPAHITARATKAA
jgi:uncharacterized protein YuzE